jgi:lantibiotic modifying enzyme
MSVYENLCAALQDALNVELNVYAQENNVTNKELFAIAVGCLTQAVVDISKALDIDTSDVPRLVQVSLSSQI